MGAVVGMGMGVGMAGRGGIEEALGQGSRRCQSSTAFVQLFLSYFRHRTTSQIAKVN